MSDIKTVLDASQWRIVADHGKNGMTFIASGLYHMNQIEKNDIPTMATDGKNIFYNKEFTLSLSKSEVDGVRIHEYFHRAFKHHLRQGDRDAEIWNIACDYAINQLILDLSYNGYNGGLPHVITLPKGALLDRKFKDKNTEWIYDYLVKNYTKMPNNQSGKDNGDGSGSVTLVPNDGQGSEIQSQSWGSFKASPMSAEEKIAESKEIDQQIMTSANQLKNIGKDTPNFLKGLLDKIKESKVSWHDILRRFIGGENTEDYSFRKPHKKIYYNYGMVAPSAEKIGVGDIVVACDTSGSVSNDELSEFLGEIKAISEDMLPTSVTIISCDSRIRNVTRYEQGEEIKTLNVSGRGGTCVQPVFKYLEEENIEFDTLVYMSDLHIWDYQKYFDKPLLWVGTKNDTYHNKPKVGEVTYIKN